jgi:hypothetical protein
MYPMACNALTSRPASRGVTVNADRILKHWDIPEERRKKEIHDEP